MDLLESLIARPGQTQEGRLPAGLAPHFADVDERGASELYALAARLAAHVRFVEARGGALADDADWTAFFRDALPADRAGGTPPHLALFAAFLKLLRIPRCAMNGITARHLEFFYRRVLGFAPRPARPDRAHLLLELKKGAEPVAIGAAHAFSAGKDASGVERLYVPLVETVINAARVGQLRSVFVDPADGGTVCFAPVANSADGLGGELRGDQPKWRAFGGPDLPAAPIGFALASPVLRMSEGERKVTLELALDGLGPAVTAALLEQKLEGFATGEKGWLGPYFFDATLAGGRLTLAFTIPASDAAVVDYDRAIHAHAFAARTPVVQVLLKVEAGKPGGYRDLLPLVVRTARISVAVGGVKSLQLESDAGTLDPKRAFTPFGPVPVPGSRFVVGCAEALSKSLSELSLDLRWLGLPADFATLYSGYTSPPDESSFTVRAAFRDGAGHAPAPDARALFEPRTDDTVHLVLLGDTGAGPGPRRGAPVSRRISALSLGGGPFLRAAVLRETLRFPVYGFAPVAVPQEREGFITLKLGGDFRIADYRASLATRSPLKEPYTPTLSEIALSYQASTQEADIASTVEADFADADVEFFHVGCFGQRREHGWLRSQLAPDEGGRVSLLPGYAEEGELLIGVGGIEAGESVSLLFKVAEGSADPDVDPQPVVRWAVLCDNYWKTLVGGDAVRDGSNNLLATGIVAVDIPAEAGTESTFLPAGLLWIKASVERDVQGVCALVSVAANAVEVERKPPGSPAARGWTPLPKGSIAKLKTPVAAVKSVTQPFASFGGSALESDEALNTRAAERLRHRNRWISAWDYERAVLDAFPEVRKAKCLPHTGTTDWLEPGEVTLVVVPDLRQRNAVDPLQPRADADTLSRIRAHIQALAPMGIGVHAKNPRYQRIRLDFKVRFRAGFEFNYSSRRLREEIVDHLCPWAQDPGQAIEFGGAVYKSQLIDFVEERDYVDFVTDFRMYDSRGGVGDSADVSEAAAATPDAILVSDATHDIAPVP